jgi:peptidyl-prolyl cis-trans isomerase B (cyclophilin B)
VPTTKQRRQAAQRHLQRQLERRAELARRRRRNMGIVATVVAVLLVAGAAFLINGVGGNDDDTTDAAATGTSAPAGGTCQFTAAETAEEGLGTPPADPPTSGTAQLTMTTNFGPIGLTLDQANAPCAAASFVHLAQAKFFDGTVCHRETDGEGLKVLQCGDPTGTGTGGPGYSFPTQVTGEETYPRGTLAMANSGQGFDQSQFFLVWGDSQLPPNYTVVGTIDEPGLATLDTIAKNGNDGSNGPGDGRPTQEVTIESMTAAA